MWCDVLCTELWCDLVLFVADALWTCDLWCIALEVAAATGEAVKAATGRTRPSRANRCLREGVTGLNSEISRGCGKRLTG